MDYHTRILEPWEKWEHALKVKDDELATLREENARLKAMLHVSKPELWDKIERLTRERDEARAAITAALDESTATKVLKLRIEELNGRVGELEGDRNYAYRVKHELEAEVGRLRAITSPGDAAAFEEHMATREAHWVAQVERLNGLIQTYKRLLGLERVSSEEEVKADNQRGEKHPDVADSSAAAALD